ncbi:phospholipase D-like domain-containing protein [Tsuneonella sp. HG222]
MRAPSALSQANSTKARTSRSAKNHFLSGVEAVVEAIRSGQIECRVYRKDKFHAKAYITHARLEVVGSSALVGSSNLTLPGFTENVELNVQITSTPVAVLQEWYEEHWDEAEDVTPEILKTFGRHTRSFSPFERSMPDRCSSTSPDTRRRLRSGRKPVLGYFPSLRDTNGMDTAVCLSARNATVERSFATAWASVRRSSDLC